MLTFIKFGGSVITDKTVAETPDLSTIRQLADELRAALDADKTLRIILGHGSGSFGHVYAKRYGVHTGIAPDADWMGYALTAAAALRLNRIVVDALLAAGVPALALQPSSTLQSAGGTLHTWDTNVLSTALARGLLPVIHGDVAFDTQQGSAIISTEQLLEALTHTEQLRPTRIILVGETGVYTADPHRDPQAQRIARINAANISDVLHATGSSHGVDVTGGMRSKVELMWRLVTANPSLTVQLIGPQPDLLTRALLRQADDAGTTIADD